MRLLVVMLPVGDDSDDRRFRDPLLRPPAQPWALTCVLSSATWSGYSGEPATTSKICCQIPRRVQRLKRLRTVVYGHIARAAASDVRPRVALTPLLVFKPDFGPKGRTTLMDTKASAGGKHDAVAMMSVSPR